MKNQCHVIVLLFLRFVFHYVVRCDVSLIPPASVHIHKANVYSLTYHRFSPQPTHNPPNTHSPAMAATDRKAVIKNADMAEDMQSEAIEVATQAMEKFNIEKDIAAYIKKEFDKKYNPTWHVIVGRNFGSYVTHETKHFLYFYLGQVAILLFKSG